MTIGCQGVLSINVRKQHLLALMIKLASKWMTRYLYCSEYYIPYDTHHTSNNPSHCSRFIVSWSQDVCSTALTMGTNRCLPELLYKNCRLPSDNHGWVGLLCSIPSGLRLWRISTGLVIISGVSWKKGFYIILFKTKRIYIFQFSI